MKTLHKQKGLTIIELVIALALFSMIAATAYSGLMQILRAQRNLLDQRDVQMLSNSIVGRISREMQMATTAARLLPPGGDEKKIYPPSVNMLGSNGRGEGPGANITFVAEDAGQYIPDGGTHSGIVQVSYRIEKIPDADNPTDEKVFYLIRDEIPLISPAKKAYAARMTFPVTNRLVSLKFKFFDLQQKKWLEEWDEKQSGLPALVNFTLQIMSPLGKVHTFSSDIALKRKTQ